MSANLKSPPVGEGGVKYYMQDWQGSVRAAANAAGFVNSRTDHQPFGEEIASGIGLRTTAQGFGAPQAKRQGYGLTEKDSTGLNHTWFRKSENRAGRWTSPDPYNASASVGNPQSWNRYSYVESQPTNFVDPSGLIFGAYPFFPMGISYYVDGMLSDARTAWGILNAGSGFLDFTNIPGIDVMDLYTGGEHNYRYGQLIHFFDGRAQLTGADLAMYLAERGRLFDLLKSSACKEFLMKSLGLSAGRIAKAVNAQRPFDAAKSTLSMYQAGLNPKIGLFAEMSVQEFFEVAGPDAGTASYARASAGATIRDVYFAASGLNAATILHEALHSFYGSQYPDDWSLAKQLGISEADYSRLGSASITETLRQNGCG